MAIELLIDGPAAARWHLLLAHGAGAGMDSPFMTDFAARVAEAGEQAGGVRVVRFEFPYMERRRKEGGKRPPDRQPKLLERFHAVIEQLEGEGIERSAMVLGGKSMGGRMASLIADEAQVGGLLCLGYPFHPPGKPEKLRTEHLLALKTPALICQGERDTFGKREEVEGFSLADSIAFHWLADGDHSFKPRKASGHTLEENMADAVAATCEFIARL